MSKLENLRHELDAQNSRIANARKDLVEKIKRQREIEFLIAELISEFKIGDKVRIDGDKRKSDDRYIVSKIELGYGGKKPEYYLRRIKKDGNPENRDTRFWSGMMNKLVMSEDSV